MGAVALDSFGNVACATSTGGIRNKMVGRVGDSPVIGKSPDGSVDPAGGVSVAMVLRPAAVMTSAG